MEHKTYPRTIGHTIVHQRESHYSVLRTEKPPPKIFRPHLACHFTASQCTLWPHVLAQLNSCDGLHHLMLNRHPHTGSIMMNGPPSRGSELTRGRHRSIPLLHVPGREEPERIIDVDAASIVIYRRGFEKRHTFQKKKKKIKK